MRDYKKINDRTLREMIVRSLGNCVEEEGKTSAAESKRRKRFFDESEMIERPGSHVKVIGFISSLSQRC